MKIDHKQIEELEKNNREAEAEKRSNVKHCKADLEVIFLKYPRLKIEVLSKLGVEEISGIPENKLLIVLKRVEQMLEIEKVRIFYSEQE